MLVYKLMKEIPNACYEERGVDGAIADLQPYIDGKYAEVAEFLTRIMEQSDDFKGLTDPQRERILRLLEECKTSDEDALGQGDLLEACYRPFIGEVKEGLRQQVKKQHEEGLGKRAEE